MYVEFDSDHTVESAYKKLIKQSAYGDSEVISSIKNEQIVFKGGRNYSVGVLVTLLIGVVMDLLLERIHFLLDSLIARTI